jgi:hypothetical protein
MSVMALVLYFRNLRAYAQRMTNSLFRDEKYIHSCAKEERRQHSHYIPPAPGPPAYLVTDDAGLCLLLKGNPIARLEHHKFWVRKERFHKS